MRTLIHAWNFQIVQPIMHIQPSEFSRGVISHYLHLIRLGARLNSCLMLFRLHAVLQIPPETLRSTLMYSEGQNNTEGHCGFLVPTGPSEVTVQPVPSISLALKWRSSPCEIVLMQPLFQK